MHICMPSDSGPLLVAFKLMCLIIILYVYMLGNFSIDFLAPLVPIAPNFEHLIPYFENSFCMAHIWEYRSLA